MAKPDHTSRVRPSNPPDGNFIPTSGDPPRSAEPVEVTLQSRAKGAEVAVAAYVLTRLLADSNAYVRDKAKGLPTEPKVWPLPPVYTENLQAAIRYLDEYTRMLGHEPGMIV